MNYLMKRLTHLAILSAAVSSLPAAAQSAQWVWSAGKQTNDGQIVLKSVKTPGATATVNKNATGATGGKVVDVRQSATTQPPVILKSGSNQWSLYYSDRTAGNN